MSETQAVYYVTKHSWRGKYKRLFAITKKGLKTFNPSAPHEDTNAWDWDELNTVSLDSKSRSQSEFLIHIKKKGKIETMKFSSEHRDELMTEAMQFYEKMAGLANAAKFNAVKHKWDESVDHCTVIVGPASLYVVLKTGQVKHRFDYRLIQGFTEITDVNGGFAVVYEEHKRLYLLGSNQRNEIIQACQEAAAAHLCIGLKRIKPGITSIDFHSRRMGDFSTDEALTSYVEFNVTKTRADGRPSTRRSLCLTENCLIERDPATYSIASLRSLQRIAGIARSKTNPQQFIIEFDNRRQNCYLSPERESLLATLLDSVRGSGNRDVCVKSSPGDPHMRWAPLYAGPDEDIETLLLKFLGSGGNAVDDAILRFNANVSASGLAFAVSQERLFAQNKEKLIEMAISALLTAKVKDPEAKFFALRRLVSSKAGFSAFTTLARFRDSLGAGVVEALKAGDDAVLCAAVDTLAALMCPMHDNADLRQEQLNKISLLSSQKFLELLLNKLKANCHPSLAIQKSAGLLMQAMIEEGSPEVVKSLQTLAIDEAGLLRCLESTESVILTDEGEMIDRDNLKVASKMSEISSVETQLLEVERAVKKQTKALLAHWRGIQNSLMFFQCYKDHQKPDLIWNYKTREELRVTLENEIRTFTDAVALIGNEEAAWNYAEFEVIFNSLSGEVQVGDYYLRVLLDMDGKQSGANYSPVSGIFLPICLHAMAIVYERCYEEIGLFEDAGYIVKLLETTKNKAERDRFVMFIEKLMLYRDNVKLVINAGGVKLLIDLVTLAHLQKNRPKTTVLQRNAIIAGEELEAELEEKEWYYGSAKGSTAEKDRTGPISSREMKRLYEEGDVTERTKVWAQGMDGWRCFVEVPQLKWTLIGEGEPILSESELSATILNIFTKMCEQYPARGPSGQLIRPPPRVKQLLCQSDALPHLVQLLLTFDVTLVEKVARLLPLILVDSPLMPRLYLTGVFYFIIMYTGNNVLPIAVFLKMTHLLQSFKSEEIMSNSLKSRSILGQIFPEAMVYYLENHSVEKFSEIFLGEFDTPEAIWNSEMRRQAIEKIAAHVADFSPRLRANTRAIYQYIPLPQIIYPSLEKELFCGYYYLRHLTNTQKFPKWPIRDPVRLLKDTLNNWRAELNKEPGGLSEDDALKTLGLDPSAGPFSEPKVRKAYFKMAQKYHPDKNPEAQGDVPGSKPSI
ncbi:unnamed protein product [Oikopleura dioica]|uniref:J domain-containing protein n=1 Tax=Oikopleura dioica TaxID=34765 RepID=E4WVU2_OIKDI|nr:unnamed protein product [Oikopleura dioica]